MYRVVSARSFAPRAARTTFLTWALRLACCTVPSVRAARPALMRRYHACRAAMRRSRARRLVASVLSARFRMAPAEQHVEFAELDTTAARALQSRCPATLARRPTRLASRPPRHASRCLLAIGLPLARVCPSAARQRVSTALEQPLTWRRVAQSHCSSTSAAPREN